MTCPNRLLLVTAAIIWILIGHLAAQEIDSLRYINPLPIPDYPFYTRDHDLRSAADPTVFYHEDKWYLYPSNGIAWWSSDMVDWHYQKVDLPGTSGTLWAPTVFEHDGAFYLTANDLGLYKAAEPLGPWKLLGPFKDEEGNTFKPFDPMLFRDDDGRVFFYFAGGADEGVFGVELYPDDLTRFAGQRIHLFTFDPTHTWEKAGDMNELSSNTWIEGPWMTKHDDRYYLQYSAPGTEFKTYSIGLYIGDAPLGPFEYDPRSPLLTDAHGLLNGTAHHSLVEGPNETYWMIYHVLYRNRDKFERRLAMDPVGFDSLGRMIVKGPSEIPQWAPGIKRNPWLGNDAGSHPLSINKLATVSSVAPGRDPEYALDNSVRTWWQAALDDSEPHLEVDLQEEFMVNSVRILWSDAGMDLASNLVPGPVQYKIEGSKDRKSWAIILDKSTNQEDMNIQFDVFSPVRARYVRLAVIPGRTLPPAGVVEFTVFGKLK